jgi:hypothetical protein
MNASGAMAADFPTAGIGVGEGSFFFMHIESDVEFACRG